MPADDARGRGAHVEGPDAPGPAGSRHALAEALAGGALEVAGNARAFEYYPCLGRVRDHVVRHLGQEITLAEAASVAGLEYHHFSRIFHERVGLCFRDWVSALRVARAMALLAQRDQSISWVGDTVGFADRRTLQRAFKRWLGMTPREFRRRVRPRCSLP